MNDSQLGGNPLSRFRNHLITGLLVVVPIFLTFWVGTFVFEILTRWSVNLLQSVVGFMSKHNLPLAETLGHIAAISPSGEFQNFWFSLAVRIASLVIIVAALFLIGVIAKWTIGRKLIDFAEWLMLKLPMLNSVYSTSRQIGEALWSPSGGMFRQVVLIEYPHKDSYVIAFLTNENKKDWEIGARTGKNLVSVFVPTTPNPTSGFLLFLPREEVHFLDMDIASGMRLVISGGVVVPPWAKDSPAPETMPETAPPIEGQL